MLQQMLFSHEPFQQFPPDIKEAYLRLARHLEITPEALAQTPDELEQDTTIPADTWARFLNLIPVQQFIRSKMRDLTSIGSRKAIFALSKKAAIGDTQATKQLNELSGILEQSDNNRIIVLHYVPRQKPQEN